MYIRALQTTASVGYIYIVREDVIEELAYMVMEDQKFHSTEICQLENRENQWYSSV